ncbi:MAG: HNH endonuclease [Candidatus Pacebacteria bacterium]|nr:HNH endonuclease [Candidatus Paceibacterota bacterium]
MWKQIEESNYEISDTGQVRNIKTNKILKGFLNEKGYACIALPLTGKYQLHRLKIHRLVAKAFLKDFCDNLDVHHINGIRNDNRVENLSCITHSENIKAIPIVKTKKEIEQIISFYLEGKTIDDILFFITNK